MGPDPNFSIKNAPLELYLKDTLRFANTFGQRYEIDTIGGERAFKVSINGTDLISKIPKPNVTTSLNPISNLNTRSYFVMHNDQPYVLDYIANAKDYQKYLPQFEHMVRSF